MYVYKIPSPQKTELCRILDSNDQWMKLAIIMQYEVATIEQLKTYKQPGESPTEQLLLKWGQLNHTVLELFSLLKDLRIYHGLECLKPFVDRKYHRLIPPTYQNDEEKELNVMPVLESQLDSIKIRNNRNYPSINREIDESNNTSPPVVDKSNVKEKCLHMHKQINHMNITRDDNAESVIELKMPNNKEPATPRIDYDELRIATSNWNQNAILGKGGFGTVYKGVWKCTKVAVKRIETRKIGDTEEGLKIQMEQSMRELYCLNTYRHDNILSLYGYSIGGDHPCLVYQFMAGGNLEQRLRTRRPEKQINWQQRIWIARGVARGLQFLHTIGDKPLIHGDIKSANILLDNSNEPKIGDFGLAREGPISDFSHIEVSRVHGTRPYLPEEFLRNRKMSTKVDTFSFGVVLFEIGTGLSAYHDSYKFLKDYVSEYVGDIFCLKDKRCPGNENDPVFLTLMNVGMECISKRARDRPEMVDVLLKLGDSMSLTM